MYVYVCMHTYTYTYICSSAHICVVYWGGACVHVHVCVMERQSTSRQSTGLGHLSGKVTFSSSPNLRPSESDLEGLCCQEGTIRVLCLHQTHFHSAPDGGYLSTRQLYLAHGSVQFSQQDTNSSSPRSPSWQKWPFVLISWLGPLSCLSEAKGHNPQRKVTSTPLS